VPILERFKSWAADSFVRAMDDNLVGIQELVRPDPDAVLLDVGCDDGVRTLQLAEATGISRLHGIELVPEAAEQARARGIEVSQANLDDRWPYDDGTFDVVVSNQVIEHVSDTDRFVAESFRVLRPGGYTVVSTENLASWHNIAALVLGWQPFSLSNVSATGGGLGNRLAVHRGEESVHKAWQHLRVFAYRGLVDLYAAHGFEVDAVRPSGYYPLPSRASRLDPRHAAFLAVRAVRPLAGPALPSR
jgi:SAM-dependent methyltransferase